MFSNKNKKTANKNPLTPFQFTFLKMNLKFFQKQITHKVVFCFCFPYKPYALAVIKGFRDCCLEYCPKNIRHLIGNVISIYDF